MAEIQYLEVGTESLEEIEKQYDRSFIECIELLELIPEGWDSEPDSIPNLKTGDPFADNSGRIYICLRVFDDELEVFQDKRWKPGWYKSNVTIVGYENKLMAKK